MIPRRFAVILRSASAPRSRCRPLSQWLARAARLRKTKMNRETVAAPLLRARPLRRASTHAISCLQRQAAVLHSRTRLDPCESTFQRPKDWRPCRSRRNCRNIRNRNAAHPARVGSPEWLPPSFWSSWRSCSRPGSDFCSSRTCRSNPSRRHRKNRGRSEGSAAEGTCAAALRAVLGFEKRREPPTQAAGQA